jgi:hypothetical protein
VVALTRLIGLLVRWFAGSRRRKVALLVLPALVVVALIAPRNGGSAAQRTPAQLAGGPGSSAGAAPSGGPTATIPQGTALPGTTGAPPSGPPPATRSPVPVPAGAAAVATGYVTTANAHDARPGKDRGFLDSYVRARPYLTPQLYALVTAPSRRGDYEWAQWRQAQATVAVQVQRVALPDGAPVPTATTAYVRVQFRQVVTPHAAGASTAAGVLPGAVTLLVARTGTKWLVSQLLADT